MSIDAIPGIRFITPVDRCYPYALDFTVASAAIGSYLSAYHNAPVTTFAPGTNTNGTPQYRTSLFAGKAGGRNLEIFPHEALTDVFVNDSRTARIPYLSPAVFNNAVGNSTLAVAETLEGLAQAMLTRYYENHLPAVEARHGRRNQNRWPSVLQFAAVIRDALSHGGVIHMFQGVPPVSHFNLSYSSASNGRRVIHEDLSCADIFFLMLEMDAAF
jgi:hypothetical protein